MNITTKDYFKILVLATVFYAGIHFVAAQSTDAPNNPPNTAVPIRTGSGIQSKQGPLKINTTLSSPVAVGLNVNQSLQLFSGVATWARLYIDELGDTTGALSGIELRKNGALQGGLFKKGGSDLTQQDISIWDRTKPVVTVKQDDSTEIAGPVRIRGGSPQAGYVLTSDSTGLATWKPQALPTTVGTPALSSTIHQYWAQLSQSSTGQVSSSCPDGELLVGFMITVQGITGGGSGKVFCRSIVYN